MAAGVNAVVASESGVTEEVAKTITETASNSGNIFKTIAGAIGINVEELSFMGILISVGLLIVLILLSKILSKIFGKAIRKSKMSESLKRFLERMVKFVLYFLSLMIFADSIGIPITSLVAVFSLFGLAISLSIQSLLSNVMSGVSLLMLKPFAVGDYIETDIAGTVHSIGLFYTEITTVDNKRVYIPNELIVKSKLTNYTYETIRRIDVQVNAAYHCEIDDVKDAINEAIDDVPGLLKDPEPIVGVAQYGNSSIIYDVRVWTSTDTYLKSKYELMEAISKSYKKHGIEMAYDRLEVNILNK